MKLHDIVYKTISQGNKHVNMFDFKFYLCYHEDEVYVWKKRFIKIKKWQIFIF